MKLRVARHTQSLQPLINFYTTILGLEIIGSFANHDNYDGVFIGSKNAGWHLEFTVSYDVPDHHADEDDLLVFYVESVDEFNAIKERCSANNIPEAGAKNPYWKDNGATYLDPDGFRIVIALNE